MVAVSLKKKTYAYFLFDKRLNLSDEARSRLQTIAEATELGAGFQVAMRDLEIRGAGEILGARQMRFSILPRLGYAA